VKDPPTRETHETLIKNKVRELRHSKTKTSLAKRFTRKASYIEITTYAPRQVPPTDNVSQLIPKKSSITARIWTLYTCKGPEKMIHNVPERD
jgi:hypothetical protein